MVENIYNIVEPAWGKHQAMENDAKVKQKPAQLASRIKLFCFGI